MSSRGMVGGSGRVRRKPQPVYDTASLASQEQLSQKSAAEEEDDAGTSSGGGSSSQQAKKKAKRGPTDSASGSSAGGGTGGSKDATGKGRGGGRGKKIHDGRNQGDEEEEQHEEHGDEEEGEEEEAEEDEEGHDGGGEDAEEGEEEPASGKRKKRTRRASAPPAPSTENASGAAKKTAAKAAAKGRRKSTGGTTTARGGRGTGVTATANEESDGDGEEFIFGGGGGGVGLGEGAENDLLEAVRRSDAALSSVVADWVSACQEDSNSAMTELLNFILLSCGAPSTEGPYEPPEDMSLVDMDGEQWAELLQVVTDDIQRAPQLGSKAASFPLAPAAKGKSGKAARMFRSNYCEVFNRLVEACRDQQNSSRGKKRKGTNMDILREVVGLLVALANNAASDDIRLAATLAGMEVGLGVAESLADLYSKLSVSQRQLDGAKSAGGGGGSKKASEKSRKIQGLENQVERITSAIEGLTEVSDLVYSKMTQKRYRDVSTEVRITALDGLTKMMLALPEIYVQDKLMRYHGWSLSDKIASVRILSLRSIQRLLRDETSSVRLDKFSGHFFSRVRGMLKDVDSTVCREAAVVLRIMFSVGFLEEIERGDEMDIEAGIFEEGLALPAKTECMGFFVDRLEEFAETDAEKAAAAAAGGVNRGKAASAKKKTKKRDAGSGADEDEEQISLIRLEALAQLASMHAKDGVGSAPATEEEERFEEHQLLACADAAVEAMWGLPQAPVLRRWRALFKLLDNDESGVSGGGGPLDRSDQTVVARMLLSSAKTATAEAKTGRRKAGGTLLGKEAKQDMREAVAELAEACLTHLPNLLAKYQSDDAKLALLAELPAYIPSEALASLVSGSGKGAFSDLLSRLKDVLLTSNSPPVMDAASSSLKWFLNTDHAKKAEVQAMAQGMVEELFVKLVALCDQDEKLSSEKKKGSGPPKGRAWKDTAISLASYLRRLRCMTGCTNAGSCVGEVALSEAWDKVEGAVTRRCLLDEVLPAKTPPSQHQDRLDAARGVVDEGINVLYSLFLWQVIPLYKHFKKDGSAAAVSEEGDAAAADGGASDAGDEDESSPPQAKKRGGKRTSDTAPEDEDALGDGTMEAEEEITEERVQAVARYRDGLVEVLRAMLAMHLYPRRDEEEVEEGGRALVEDGIEGVPRVLTADQKTRLVGPARLAAWKISNELRTVLKEFLLGAEGPYASLAWVPDVPFTRLLQELFEEMEDAMVTSSLRTSRQRKQSSRNRTGAKNGPKREPGEGDGSDSSDEDGDDDDDLELEGLDQDDLPKDLLVPLMKSIYSNADKLNRRQAAAIVAHLVRSSKTGGSFAKCFVSKLKEHSPVKCLEVHMATLRVFYDKWIVAAAAADGDDEEDRTEEENMRKQWEQDQAGMDRWLPLARRLSMSLGLGPLRSKDADEQKTLQDLFFGFMKVGVRFGLSHSEGERLLFLEGMKEYSSKVTARQKKLLGKIFDEEVKGLEEDVLEEGREYATLWDSGDGQHEVAPRWRAFFSFRNSLVPGPASSFVPEIRGYGHGDGSSVSPSNSVTGSSMGTPASRGTKTSSWRTTRKWKRRMKRGGRATNQEQQEAHRRTRSWRRCKPPTSVDSTHPSDVGRTRRRRRRRRKKTFSVLTSIWSSIPPALALLPPLPPPLPSRPQASAASAERPRHARQPFFCMSVCTRHSRRPKYTLPARLEGRQPAASKRSARSRTRLHG